MKFPFIPDCITIHTQGRHTMACRPTPAMVCDFTYILSYKEHFRAILVCYLIMVDICMCTLHVVPQDS